MDVYQFKSDLIKSFSCIRMKVIIIIIMIIMTVVVVVDHSRNIKDI